MVPRSCFLTILTLGIRVALSQPSILQDIAHLESSKSPLLQYPTQLTQGIVPKAIHSHNDCKPLLDCFWSYTPTVIPEDWRDVPLYTALSLGVASVEADVWLVNGTLFVSHSNVHIVSGDWWFIDWAWTSSIDEVEDIRLAIHNTSCWLVRATKPSECVYSGGKSDHTQVIIYLCRLMFTNWFEILSGLFDTSSGTPLQLLVDIKTDGQA